MNSARTDAIVNLVAFVVAVIGVAIWAKFDPGVRDTLRELFGRKPSREPSGSLEIHVTHDMVISGGRFPDETDSDRDA